MVSSAVKNQVTEIDLVKKLREWINKLKVVHLMSIYQYHSAQEPNVSKAHSQEWNSAQVQAAETIRNGLHPSFHHHYLKLKVPASHVHALRLIEPRTGASILLINVRQFQASQPAEQAALLDLSGRVVERWADS